MIELRKFSWMIKKELLSLKRHPPRLISILIFSVDIAAGLWYKNQAAREKSCVFV